MQSKPLTLASDAGAVALDAATPGRGTALREALQLLDPYMQDRTITEVCINRPGEVYTESNFGWQRHDTPDASLAWCRKVAQLAATFSEDRINEKTPILSGVLPGGERVQIVVPPAVEHGTVSVTIRKPSFTTMTREELEGDGLTDEVADQLSAFTLDEERLLLLKSERRFWEFFELAVRTKKNIVISGATGSGKTTLAKTLLNYIPTHERIITIEDVREIFLPNHGNRVHLLHSAGGSGTSDVTAKELLQCCLRQKPDRILLAEIRSKVAYDYIVNTSSGHPGSITTTHAGTCSEAFEMLMLRVKESDEGRELSRDDIMSLLRAKIDVVIQLQVFDEPGHDGRVRKKRRITEVYYDPAFKRTQLV